VSGTRGKPAVLIVDDDPIIRRLVAATLRADTFRLLQAGTAIEALKIAREELPHLVFLDVRLAGEDGLRVLKMLKEDPRTSSSRVVMLSAHDDPVTRLRARQAGADGFFAKPFSPLALWSAVDDLLA
jgi:DNA-binding response OmpR family regulator